MLYVPTHPFVYPARFTVHSSHFTATTLFPSSTTCSCHPRICLLFVTHVRTFYRFGRCSTTLRRWAYWIVTGFVSFFISFVVTPTTRPTRSTLLPFSTFVHLFRCYVRSQFSFSTSTLVLLRIYVLRLLRLPRRTRFRLIWMNRSCVYVGSFAFTAFTHTHTLPLRTPFPTRVVRYPLPHTRATCICTLPQHSGTLITALRLPISDRYDCYGTISIRLLHCT